MRNIEKQLRQMPPSKYDDPDEIGRALKRLGLGAVNIAKRFAGRLINKLPQDPPRASSIE